MVRMIVHSSIKVCAIDGCEKPVDSRGWCRKHYTRWQRHGDPSAVKVIHGDEAARFWPKVDRGEGCWLWIGGVSTSGYGAFKSAAGGHYAHRWSYADANGPIPEGMVIDHLCRTPLCVRPEHLEAVTPGENIRRGAGGFELTGLCHRGHDITDPANVVAQRPGARTCRTCREAQQGRAHNCHVSECGNRRCLECGERMTCLGPEPAPRCPDHDTCQDCADEVVHCRECGEVLRQVAEDRAEQAAFDASRERA